MRDAAGPKWREDFPIKWGADTYITRREFTKFLVLASAAAAAGNGYFAFQRRRRPQQMPTVQIAGASDLEPGQVKLFRYPTQDDFALLLRLSNGEYAAYKQRCTHLSCPVHFAPERGRLECPCHNGAFDAATGAVLEGPPPRPLPRIALKFDQGQIFAVGVQGLMIQKDPYVAKLEQTSQTTATVMFMVIVVLLVQLWLLSIALEEFMAAQGALALPTFAASAVCLAINLWLLKYVHDTDRELDKQ